MTKIKLRREKFTSNEAKEEFAKLMSGIINAERCKSVPYRPNEHDWNYWTIDNGNDWKIKFYPEEPDMFGISYRYNVKDTQDYEDKLAQWLTVRLRGIEILGDEGHIR